MDFHVLRNQRILVTLMLNIESGLSFCSSVAAKKTLGRVRDILVYQPIAAILLLSLFGESLRPRMIICVNAIRRS
jgi:hypothetical protein